MTGNDYQKLAMRTNDGNGEMPINAQGEVRWEKNMTT